MQLRMSREPSEHRSAACCVRMTGLLACDNQGLSVSVKDPDACTFCV